MTYTDKKALALAMINLHAQMAAANVIVGNPNEANGYLQEVDDHINTYELACNEEEAEIRATTPRMM
jgi:hypothetical protein